MCVSAARGNVFKSPKGADTGGHRRRLCLCGHHPHRLGVCGVSEVSDTHTHTDCKHLLSTILGLRVSYSIYSLKKKLHFILCNIYLL